MTVLVIVTWEAVLVGGIIWSQKILKIKHDSLSYGMKDGEENIYNKWVGQRLGILHSSVAEPRRRGNP